ncbi:outer membrane beta-barrel protein [Shewanella donghaensis]|uniref:outer membrane beta-barrel protein n=1 Tax=Shewanella donghaensis TaxID=238836 RepID=UPI0011827796|nr:outer membrane beta-barrel protein [Shewanella donghaensis]
MKTKNLILAGVISTVMSVPAMASDWFVGGAAGYQQDNYKISSGIEGNNNTKEKDMSYQLRAGSYLNDNTRLYGTYGYNSDDIARQQTFLLSYDYLVGLGDSNKLNWFIGATAGMTHNSIKDSNFDSKNTFVWGGQTGLMYNLNDKWSTEVGYRYLKQDYDVNTTNGANSGSFALNDTQQVYLAIDYKF